MTNELERMANIAARKISHDSNDWGLITAGYLAGAKAVLEYARKKAHDEPESNCDVVYVADLEKFVEGE